MKLKSMNILKPLEAEEKGRELVSLMVKWDLKLMHADLKCYNTQNWKLFKLSYMQGI